MIVIGDVHGCFETLSALVDKLPEDKICFTGDLIDRGPKSFEVVEFVINNGHRCVLGNHEEFLLLSEKSDETKDLWFMNGGDKTIQSYKENGYSEIPPKHMSFFRNLPDYKIFKINNKDCLIVSHSSAAEYILNDHQPKYRDWMLWDRPSFPKKIPGLYNIYGHTPGFKPIIKDHFAVIDTYCFGKNKLTALQYPSMKIFDQKYID